uniref:proline racemase family protein n=1 Tax=Pararhizobium sp. IMCC3301 TaxID=3067904 RepID=UPI0027426BE0|nr:proline racemase family protein [Pararhizobium sp. IMCC3301]
MRWKRTLQLVDVHCGGEVGRVVMSGVLDVPGATMATKLDHINTVDDSLRRLLTLEPRSGPAGGVVLLVPSTRPDADVGLIVLLADAAHAMSGSNAMCATTALLETGTIKMTEPETQVVFDTAAGLVTAIAKCRDGRVEQVSIDMPPSFVERTAVQLDVSDLGSIALDICFGGVFYAIVDAGEIGLDIVPENARALATAGVKIRNALAVEIPVQHPSIPELNSISYAMFIKKAENGVITTCTTLRPGRADRSACGTGSAALIAREFSQNHLAIGDTLVTRSIIGSCFSSTITGTEQIGPFSAVRSRLTGQCWLFGFSQIGLDPTDPFPTGFTLSDTWGESL